MADISLLLEQAGKGDRATQSELLELVHDELHRLASAFMRQERAGHVLQPTALVNEAYLRLLGGRPISFAGRAHFFRTASRVMRQILVDHARSELTAKRKGERVELDPEAWAQVSAVDRDQLLAIDAALNRLREISARCADVVELRFFGGLSGEDISDVLSISPRTVKREWQFARAWLESQLRTGQ